MNREEEILERIIEKTPQNFGIEIDQCLEAMRELARERAIGFAHFYEENKFRKFTTENLSDDQLYSKYEEHLKK